MAVMACLTGCAHKSAQVKPAPPVDDSYVDLTAGGRLRIVVPLLKSGGNQSGYRPATNPIASSGGTIILSAGDLIGYEVSMFSLEGRGKGKVRLKFASAEVTKNGTTVPEAERPTLPFALPSKSAYVRLIYLIRNSASDHNMAITAAKNMDALNDFTKSVRANPALCGQSGGIFCAWVPAGIAVRPEQ